MELSLSLDAKEVLFHLNYMGYRNVSKEQLKDFMGDLKKLMKYEKSPRMVNEVPTQAGPSTENVQRLFEAHTVASKTKQKEPKASARPLQPVHQLQRAKPATIVEEQMIEKTEPRPARVRSADAHRRVSRVDSIATLRKSDTQPTRKNEQPEQIDKENNPSKSKMWIRPKNAPLRVRSASTTRKPVRKTDPVSLYHAYQKDWERFRSQICESSHSDLRWSIREKMMGGNR